MSRFRPTLTALAIVIGLPASASLGAQTQMPDQLAAQLRQGGYVLVVRHASSPGTLPTKEQARPGNNTLERQLDDAGRRDAAAMGDALRTLQIPIGTVLTSPAYRARETARMARLDAKTANELSDNGQSMEGVTETQAAWLRTKAAERPATGNTVLVTHQPNVARAFPGWGAGVQQGETVVLRPDGNGGFTVAGRIPIREWPRLR
jgi:phosphohistidine phosphatase SixA